MEYDTKRVRDFTDKAVRRQGKHRCVPRFHAVTGSHIYGFPSEDGDVDVRGFHTAPLETHSYLERPKEQIEVNQGGVTEGFEDHSEIDLVSYELRKFGYLVYKANFNVLEVLFCGDSVNNGVPLETEALRDLVENHLPLDVPKTYFGMAKSNYKKFLNRDGDRYRPEAKKFLYVLRGLYAAQYVQEQRTIESNVRKLSKAVEGDTDFVDDLIHVKIEAEEVTVDRDLADRSHSRIHRLFNEAEAPEAVDKTEYRKEIDQWMKKIRGV